jgi:hypothetical protein
VVAQGAHGTGNVPHLLLEVRGRSVAGLADGIVLGATSVADPVDDPLASSDDILRWNLRGGVAPAAALCTDATLGSESIQAYSADYYFLDAPCAYGAYAATFDSRGRACRPCAGAATARRPAGCRPARSASCPPRVHRHHHLRAVRPPHHQLVVTGRQALQRVVPLRIGDRDRLARSTTSTSACMRSWMLQKISLSPSVSKSCCRVTPPR